MQNRKQQRNSAHKVSPLRASDSGNESISKLKIVLTKVSAELATTKAALKKMQREEAARLKRNAAIDKEIEKFEKRIAANEAESAKHKAEYEKKVATQENRSKISELVNGFLYFNPKEIFA